MAEAAFGRAIGPWDLVARTTREGAVGADERTACGLLRRRVTHTLPPGPRERCPKGDSQAHRTARRAGPCFLLVARQSKFFRSGATGSVLRTWLS